ncbi:hypothetical protein DFP72DRAFT_533529 [Ephemerocybe angulata]|uniref:Uncharacterized protein n=1 Tax=Ephemerocybe angulata TaxID=980116 RepID=A0A8H6HPH3_9AGAR|nr:hypothetical protein DFP72DRAFT_533529 [Tulosesus angulatus]
MSNGMNLFSGATNFQIGELKGKDVSGNHYDYGHTFSAPQAPNGHRSRNTNPFLPGGPQGLVNSYPQDMPSGPTYHPQHLSNGYDQSYQPHGSSQYAPQWEHGGDPGHQYRPTGFPHNQQPMPAPQSHARNEPTYQDGQNLPKFNIGHIGNANFGENGPGGVVIQTDGSPGHGNGASWQTSIQGHSYDNGHSYQHSSYGHGGGYYPEGRPYIGGHHQGGGPNRDDSAYYNSQPPVAPQWPPPNADAGRRHPQHPQADPAPRGPPAMQMPPARHTSTSVQAQVVVASSTTTKTALNPFRAAPPSAPIQSRPAPNVSRNGNPVRQVSKVDKGKGKPSPTSPRGPVGEGSSATAKAHSVSTPRQASPTSPRGTGEGSSAAAKAQTAATPRQAVVPVPAAQKPDPVHQAPGKELKGKERAHPPILLVRQKPASDSEPEDETTTYPAVAKKPSIRYPAPQSSQSAATSSKTSENVEEAKPAENQASIQSGNVTQSPANGAEATITAARRLSKQSSPKDSKDSQSHKSRRASMESDSDSESTEFDTSDSEWGMSLTDVRVKMAAEDLAEAVANGDQQPVATTSAYGDRVSGLARSGTASKAPARVSRDMSLEPPAYAEEATPRESGAHQAPVSSGYYYGRDSKKAKENSSSIQQRDPIDDMVTAPFDSLELVDSYTPGTGEDRAIGPAFSSSESLAVEKKKPKSFFKRVSKVLGGSKKGPYPEFHGNLRIE